MLRTEATSSIFETPRIIHFRGQENQTNSVKQQATSISIPPAATSPPKRKTPSWTKALLISGLSLLGLGQVKPYINPEITQHIEKKLQSLVPDFQETPSGPGYRLQFRTLNSDYFQLNLGPHQFTFKSSEYDLVKEATNMIQKEYTKVEILSIEKKEMAQIIEHSMAFARCKASTPND